MIYSVILKTCGSHYYPLCGIPSERKYTASIEECQRRVREYISRYNLSSDNWNGGQVYDGLGEYIGKISYTGYFVRGWHTQQNDLY